MELKAGSLIQSLLRILTVEEINELTTTSSGLQKVPLAEIVQLKIKGEEIDVEKIRMEMVEADKLAKQKKEGSGEDGHEAKILPLHGEEEAKDQSAFEKDIPDIDLICGKRCKQLMQAWSLKFEEMEKNLLGAKRLPRRLEGIGQKQMSTFILEEKKKFEESFGKLKKREVMTLYNQTAAVNLEVQRANKDDLSKSSQTGVLVNRKQA